MRLNKYVASATGMSRRRADNVIANNRVLVNQSPPEAGYQVQPSDDVTLDDKPLKLRETTSLLLNKPVGYVCSRAGQGSQTIYGLLPPEFHHLKPVGRLDKDSSGLLLLTNDGDLAYQLTHPSFEKIKKYHVVLSQEITKKDFEQITKHGVQLHDGLSRFKLEPVNDNNYEWIVTMHEGRNRQIRRTFATLNFNLNKLHRIQLGPYRLDELPSGQFITI